jgi:hypothetical protein
MSRAISTKAKSDYENGRTSFINGLLPEKAVQLPTIELIDILSKKLGPAHLRKALSADYVYPSPLRATENTDWMRQTNMVGINVRTIGNFWNMVKYALTLPATQQSIHILPIWEPGVVASLYGMASWNINPEFFSQELYHFQPQLDTVEKQLKVCINILHALGKVVGMDVIPHTDRYSEIVLANPQYFEWLRRADVEIVDHRANLHEAVQEHIYQFLRQFGSADWQLQVPYAAHMIFLDHIPEEWKLRLLFGDKRDYAGRNRRRGMLVDYLYRRGFEPVPATMAPPYRGLEVDPNEDAKTIDEWGRVWRDYRITQPEKMSRVFGPLTRYKLYDRLDDNQDWQIDFSKPRVNVWAYVKKRYSQVQRQFNFDFMRGDMSHVQMRAEGVPAEPVPYYDIHQEVKRAVIKAKPFFSYYAESFLAPPDTMGYGDEIAHLEASEAEVTLGDLQSMVVGGPIFMKEFKRYLEIAEKTDLTPCFTIMTADKDDPRFDEFYVAGNEARLFTGLFLTDIPSYMGLGFESRDTHLQAAPNEHYTKLYVFQIAEGPKATTGPYIWGQNHALFARLNQIRTIAETILPQIESASTKWLKKPGPKSKQIAWTQAEQAKYTFVVNLDLKQVKKDFKIDLNTKNQVQLIFSTRETEQPKFTVEKQQLKIATLNPGECCIFMH